MGSHPCVGRGRGRICLIGDRKGEVFLDGPQFDITVLPNGVSCSRISSLGLPELPELITVRWPKLRANCEWVWPARTTSPELASSSRPHSADFGGRYA
jgi:hypothetical protein